MAKKIVKVEDTKAAKKSSLDIGKITELISENGEAIGKITEGITELIDNKDSKSKKSSKKTKKSSSNKDSLSTVIDIAGTILKNK